MVLLLMEYYISLRLIGIMKGLLTHYFLGLLRIIDRWSYQQVILNKLVNIPVINRDY